MNSLNKIAAEANVSIKEVEKRYNSFVRFLIKHTSCEPEKAPAIALNSTRKYFMGVIK